MTTKPRMTEALRKALSRLASSPGGELEPYLRRGVTAEGEKVSRVDPRTIANLKKHGLVKVESTEEGALYSLTASGCALAPQQTEPQRERPPEMAVRVEHAWSGSVGTSRSWYSTADLTIDEWRARRFEYVGASEISAVLGLNPYRGPLDVWQEKTGVISGDLDLQVMRLGTLFEPTIIEFARREFGLTIYDVPELLGHETHDCLRCNLDGLAIIDGEQVVVECKHAGARGSREHLRKLAESGTVTPGTSVATWYVQIQSQLVVTGLKRALLVALCDKDFHVIEIERDVELCDLILRNVPAWWSAFVETKTEPPATRADGAANDRKYEDADPKLEPLELSDTLSKSLEELRELRENKRGIDERMKELTIGLKAFLGERETATIDGDRAYSWKSSTRTTVDLEALRAAHPDIAAKFAKTTTSRRFNY